MLLFHYFFFIISARSHLLRFSNTNMSCFSFQWNKSSPSFFVCVSQSFLKLKPELISHIHQTHTVHFMCYKKWFCVASTTHTVCDTNISHDDEIEKQKWQNKLNKTMISEIKARDNHFISFGHFSIWSESMWSES